MAYFNDPWRSLAKAAKLRDWATIDAVLEDQKALGKSAVLHGFSDARRESGEVPRLQGLDRPEPVTIHDLSAEERARVDVVNEGSAIAPLYRYRPKKAA